MIKIIILLLTLITLLSLVVIKINSIKSFNRKSKLYLIIILFFITLFFLLSLRFFSDKGADGTYVPAKFEGNQLIPGKVEFAK